MKGKENLIPTNRRSKEEARQLGYIGGIKSGQVRKEKAELKKLFMQYALMQPTEEEKKRLVKMGYDKSDLTNMTSYVVSLFQNGANGNPKALELGYQILTENNKKELEILRLQEEINKLKLEQKKIERDLGGGSNDFEDLTPLAELLKPRN